MKYGIEIILVLVLIAGVAWGISRIIKRARHGSGCCGEHASAEKKIGVADKKKSHYPYAVTLTVEGMTCENCARRVENTLNTLDGVWAKVDIGSHKAKVRLKQPIENDVLIRAIRDAGYSVSDMKL